MLCSVPAGLTLLRTTSSREGLGVADAGSSRTGSLLILFWVILAFNFFVF